MKTETNVEPIIAPASAAAGKKPKKHRLRAFLTVLFAVFASLATICCFVMYGPYDFYRNLWVNTAMETMNHQWLASLLYDNATIAAIRADTAIKSVVGATNPDLIDTSDYKVPADNATELPTSASEGEHIIGGIGYIRIQGDYGKGWVIKVYDPNRLTMGISENFGTKGEQLSSMVTRLGAVAGVNAGGFLDVEGHGNGGTPDQIFIYNYDILQEPTSSGSHHIIGITKAHKLVLGTYTYAQLLKQNFKYAVEFWPFIIQDGKLLDYSGYTSYQPRTAIGQTKDGTFIFVVIDGRYAGGSRGASLGEVQEIMQSYGCVNAANLDGGSSTEFVYKGKVENNPSTPIGERYLPDAFLITAS